MFLAVIGLAGSLTPESPAWAAFTAAEGPSVAAQVGADGMTRSPVDSGWPPDMWRGDNSVIAHFTSDISQFCGVASDPKLRILACAQGDQMALPNPCSPEFIGEFFAKLTCHELAHTNGWPGDHPRPAVAAPALTLTLQGV